MEKPPKKIEFPNSAAESFFKPASQKFHPIELQDTRPVEPSTPETPPEVKPEERAAALKGALDFSEYHPHMGIMHDLIGMVRHRGEKVETYSERLHRESKKGAKEAASYGKGKIGNEEVVLYMTNWDFMGGSTGVVAGEKFLLAVDRAVEENVPLVGFYSTGGMRQDENSPGLWQMTRMTHAISSFRERSTQPYVAILDHKVYGGISASVVPLADIKVAIEGGDFGFAGPNVIEGYERVKVPEGAQSVEAHYRYRNIDFLVKDVDDLDVWLSQLLHHSRHGRESKLPEEIKLSFQHINDLPDAVRFPFTKQGFSVGFTQGSDSEKEVYSSQREVEYHSLLKRYDALQRNPFRPDTDYLLHQLFTDVVPFYNREVTDKMISYPAIIAGLGRIGDKSYLVIGDQPKYQLVGNSIHKIPASPLPEDFHYLERMLEFGERLGIPAVLFTDTMGAKPTLDAETRGQPEAIARVLLAGSKYKEMLLTVNIGILGSGGGLATTPMGDRMAMLENSLTFVAEGKSSAVIVLKNPNPSAEEVEKHIHMMRATANDQLDLGLIDEVIPEPEGAWKNPHQTAENILRFIVDSTLDLQKLSERTRLKKRRDRVRNVPGLPLKLE